MSEGEGNYINRAEDLTSIALLYISMPELQLEKPLPTKE